VPWSTAPTKSGMRSSKIRWDGPRSAGVFPRRRQELGQADVVPRGQNRRDAGAELGGRVAQETGPKRTRGGERPDDAGTGGRYHEAAPSTSRMIRLVPLGSTYDPGSSAAMC
jgi:hypothetical protein